MHRVLTCVVLVACSAPTAPSKTPALTREVDESGSASASAGPSVYNEMVRVYESGDSVMWRLIGKLVYGAQHPLALESGGYPAAIRTMTPEDIRRFHDATYHLANMGMVGAFPSSMQRFLEGLAAASQLPRAQLVQLAALARGAGPAVAPAIRPWADALHKLSPAAGALAGKALTDLKALLTELPDGSLAADWGYLCKQMAHDLGVGAPAALDHLRAVRNAIVAAGNARVVAVGSAASHAALAADVATLIGKLDRAPRARQVYPALQPIAARLRDHDRGAGEARYVALVNPSTSGGVFINSAPATGLTDTSDDALLDYLASNTFVGHGAHTLWMKTIEAGLAYGNGVHSLVHDAQIEYYAERCPRLPQTLSFVIATLRAARSTSTSRATRSRGRSTRGSRRATRRAPRRWRAI